MTKLPMSSECVKLTHEKLQGLVPNTPESIRDEIMKVSSCGAPKVFWLGEEYDFELANRREKVFEKIQGYAEFFKKAADTICEMVPLYQALGHAFEWMLGGMGQTKRWQDHCNDWIDHLETLLPSGSGIDNGTIIDREKSTGNKLVFSFGYHHMDAHGCYDGWTEHTMTVVPTFSGFDISALTGPDRNDIKDSLYQTYEFALRELTPRHHSKDD